MLVSQYDEPFGDSSALPTYLVSRFARESVKVCLSGDGGDEVFAGYDSYTAMQRSARLRWVPAPIWRLLASATPSHRVLHKRFRLMGLDEGRRFTELTGIFPSWERPWLYRETFSEALCQARAEADIPEPADRFLPFFELPGPATLLDRMANQDIHAYLTDDILAKVDRASMLNSLEVRTPILDHPLVEFAARIPASIRMAGGQPKHLLRSLARRLVPPQVIDRPKKGFGVPLRLWFRGELLPYARKMLLGPDAASRVLLDPRATTFVIDRHQRGGRDFNHQVWLLLVLEHWCRQHPAALRNLSA
jgi:asparagine synthase (glutamine-hydrolysing)